MSIIRFKKSIKTEYHQHKMIRDKIGDNLSRDSIYRENNVDPGQYPVAHSMTKVLSSMK